MILIFGSVSRYSIDFDIILDRIFGLSYIIRSTYWIIVSFLGHKTNDLIFTPFLKIWSYCAGKQAQWVETKAFFLSHSFSISGYFKKILPVLPLHSEAWWQYWLIHPTQNYCILIVSISTFVPNIVFFSILVHVLIRRIEIFQF